MVSLQRDDSGGGSGLAAIVGGVIDGESSRSGTYQLHG
jgi:hypothetical protein